MVSLCVGEGATRLHRELPGRVAVSLFPFEVKPAGSWRAAKLEIVDATSGEAVFRGDGLVPADRLGFWISPVLAPAEAGAPWSTLVLDADSRVVRLDPTTGAKTVLVGRSK